MQQAEREEAGAPEALVVQIDGGEEKKLAGSASPNSGVRGHTEKVYLDENVPDIETAVRVLSEGLPGVTLATNCSRRVHLVYRIALLLTCVFGWAGGGEREGRGDCDRIERSRGAFERGACTRGERAQRAVSPH